MPVTVRFSSKFYEKPGDDVAGELVDWCNAVDQSYRDQLKEMNESFWERLKTHLDAELTKVRADMSTIRAEMSTMRAEMRSEIDKMRADLITWMFVFWLANGGLILGLRFFGPK